MLTVEDLLTQLVEISEAAQQIQVQNRNLKKQVNQITYESSFTAECTDSTLVVDNDSVGSRNNPIVILEKPTRKRRPQKRQKAVILELEDDIPHKNQQQQNHSSQPIDRSMPLPLPCFISAEATHLPPLVPGGQYMPCVIQDAARPWAIVMPMRVPEYPWWGGMHFMANASALRLYGYRQEDFPVPDAITLAYDAESAAINLQARKDSVACLSDKELLVYGVSGIIKLLLRMRRKDGKIIEVHARQQCFFSDKGDPHFSFLTFDRVRFVPTPEEDRPSFSLKRKRPHAPTHPPQIPLHSQPDPPLQEIAPEHRLQQQDMMREYYERPHDNNNNNNNNNSPKRQKGESVQQPLLLPQPPQPPQPPQQPQKEEIIIEVERRASGLFGEEERRHPLYSEADASTDVLGDQLFGPIVVDVDSHPHRPHNGSPQQPPPFTMQL